MEDKDGWKKRDNMRKKKTEKHTYKTFKQHDMFLLEI